MTGFAAALFHGEGNEDPTLVVVTPPPAPTREPSPDYERALGDLAAVLREEVGMPDCVLAYFLDLARARERAR